jgi:TonB-dependent SusC/RagA subfamily outer membrane receptor
MRLIRSAKFMAFALALVAPALAQAQQPATITGRVVGDQGQPLVGANVFINEMNISVGTNAAGQYTITVPQARLAGQSVILRARAIGYSPQSQQIRLAPGTQTVNFELRRELTQLSEVVVTGVTTATEQRKLAFTVTRVDSTMMPVTGSNPITQLQGKVPGAIIMNPSGRPGAAPQVILRGPTSLNATGRTQQPLYLLDGVPLQGSLPDINPDDIESVEVVKGAAAASIYGARAGAGVINITTKTGRHAQQGIRFGLRTEIGASDIEREFPLSVGNTLVLSPDGTRFCSREVLFGASTVGTIAGQNAGAWSSCARYVDWDQEVQRINNSGVDFSLPAQSFMHDFGISNTPNYDQATGTYQATAPPFLRDPVGQAVTRNAFSNSNIDLRGRLNNTGVYASVSNLVQEGSVRFLPGFTRNSVRANLDQSFGGGISGSINTFYSASRDHASQFDETGSGVAGTWFQLSRAPWMSNLVDRDNLGRIVIRHNPLFQGDQNANPLYATANNFRVDRGNRFVGGLNVRYQPLGWLNFDGLFGYDRQTGQYLQMRDRGWRTTNSAPATSSGFIGEGSWDNEQWNTGFSATAQRNFFGDLNAAASARYVFSDQNIRNNALSGIGLALPGLITADAATTNLAIGSGRAAVRDMAFFYGVDLDYKDRYILGGLVRRDGSSLFGSGQRWQTFGRVSAAWLVSSEPWWFAPQAVSLFKLRAARGSTGQRPRFDAQYETFTIGTGGTLNPNFLGNRNLRPEVNTETEVGTDIELFGRYGVNFSYSRAVIDHQILPVQLSSATGFASQWLNAGEITNTGYEATLTVPLLTRGSVNWTSRFIWDQMKSEITRLDIPEFVGTIAPGPTNTFDIFKFRQGERIGTVYGFDMVRRCDQLPAPFSGQCSMSSGDLNAAFRPNNDGYIVWVGAGNSLGDGITRNLWRSHIPAPSGAAATACLAGTGACPTPWGMRLNWGMPIVLRDETNNADFHALGSGLPKYHWGYSQNFDWRRLSLYGLLDANIGQRMWNVAYHWSMGDLTSSAADQTGRSVEDAKPVGYYWRRGPSASPGGSSGVGGLYDVLAVHGWSFEDASYVKLRELSANYRVGPIGGRGDWRVGIVGRNLKTWTDWSGFDPESGNTTGPLNSSILTPVAGYRFPNLRTYTLQLSSTF